MKRAVILSTGDELTTGKVIDTNAAVIGERLYGAGFPVAAVLKTGDDRPMLLWALDQARQLGDVIIGSGGLGPTTDDLTAAVVAEFVGRPLIRNAAVEEALRQRYLSRGLALKENSLKQALFPEGAEIIPNPLGTAPGFRLSVGPGKDLLWLSGVPQEMTAMLDETVMPWVMAQHAGAAIVSSTFKIHGLTESELDDLLRPLALPANGRFSFRAHFPDLTLRLTFTGALPETRIYFRDQVRRLLGPAIYAEEDITMEECVGRLLLEKGLTLALAESCTGGLISRRITRIAGSSRYYCGGAVTYANQAKIDFLGVRPETLENHGAVSEATALEMSHGIKHRTGANVGFSVTGIAGPSGGSPDKPVGTVWMSIAHPSRHEARLFRFSGDRERIILGASQAGLNWLRSALLH
jgi:nicotinamide-nucleotide amidase